MRYDHFSGNGLWVAHLSEQRRTYTLLLIRYLLFDSIIFCSRFTYIIKGFKVVKFIDITFTYFFT